MVDVSSVAAQAPALGSKYSQPSQGGGYAPSEIYSSIIRVGGTPEEATTLTAISGPESNFGKSPISPPNKNGSRDYGVYQINDAAHPQMGGAAVAHMPLDQQSAYALQIARDKIGFNNWTTYKTGAYKPYLKQVGSTAGAPGSSAPSAPSAPSPAVQQAQQQPFNMGAALGALTGQSQGGGQQQQMGGGGGDEQAPDASGQLQLQMAAAGGNARQAQIAGQAAQLAAALRQQSAQPLTWGQRPFGSTAGPQTQPGTTLNSMGA